MEYINLIPTVTVRQPHAWQLFSPPRSTNVCFVFNWNVVVVSMKWVAVERKRTPWNEQFLTIPNVANYTLRFPKKWAIEMRTPWSSGDFRHTVFEEFLDQYRIEIFFEQKKNTFKYLTSELIESHFMRVLLWWFKNSFW